MIVLIRYSISSHCLISLPIISIDFDHIDNILNLIVMYIVYRYKQLTLYRFNCILSCIISKVGTLNNILIK